MNKDEMPQAVFMHADGDSSNKTRNNISKSISNALSVQNNETYRKLNKQRHSNNIINNNHNEIDNKEILQNGFHDKINTQDKNNLKPIKTQKNTRIINENEARQMDNDFIRNGNNNSIGDNYSIKNMDTHFTGNMDSDSPWNMDTNSTIKIDTDRLTPPKYDRNFESQSSEEKMRTSRHVKVSRNIPTVNLSHIKPRKKIYIDKDTLRKNKKKRRRRVYLEDEIDEGREPRIPIPPEPQAEIYPESLVQMKRLPMPNFHILNDLQKEQYWLIYIDRFEKIRQHNRELAHLLPEIKEKNYDHLPLLHMYWDEIYHRKIVSSDSTWYKVCFSIAWPVMEMLGKMLKPYLGISLENYTNFQLSFSYLYDEISYELAEQGGVGFMAGWSPWTKLIVYTIASALAIIVLNLILKYFFGDGERKQNFTEDLLSFISQQRSPMPQAPQFNHPGQEFNPNVPEVPQAEGAPWWLNMLSQGLNLGKGMDLGGMASMAEGFLSSMRGGRGGGQKKRARRAPQF